MKEKSIFKVPNVDTNSVLALDAQNTVLASACFGESRSQKSEMVPKPLDFPLPPIQDYRLGGGEEIKSGTLQGGEEIKPGTLHGGEEIKPGTLHATSYSPATYRTRDGRTHYKFRYVDINGKFEIDILSQPSYFGRDESSAISHRLPSTRGGNKICLSEGKEPTNLETAKKVSMEWAELTTAYINSGKSIDRQVKDNSSPLIKLWSSLVH